MSRRILWSAISLLVGLFAITMFVESLEFGVVSIANGGVTTDPSLYWSVRNQTWILVAKLGYNAVGAFLGGYLAAKLAAHAPFQHGVALATLQTLAFVWALTQPEIRDSTPLWIWLALIPTTAAGILWGAHVGTGHRNDKVRD